MARAITSMDASLSGATVGGGIVVGGVELVCAKNWGKFNFSYNQDFRIYGRGWWD